MKYVTAVATMMTVALGVVSGCEAITSRDGLQCETTQDCTDRGADFAGTVCSAGVCEAITVPQTTSSTTCTTSESCLFSLKEPGRCVDGQCISLVPTSTVTGSPLCQTFGPVANDSAILVGALSPYGTTLAGAAAAGIAVPAGMADPGSLLNDILSAWNTTAAAATPPAPQVASVSCDESDLAGSLALFNSVHPAFLLGPYTSASLAAVIQANPSFPLLAATGDSADLESSPSAQRWSCAANLADIAPSFANAIDVVARKVAADRSKTTVKVAYVQDSSQPDEAKLADAILTTLTFNGESPSTSGAFLSVDVNSGSDKIAIESTTSGVGISQASQLAIFQPDVVVLSGPLWTTSLLDNLERRWSALNHSLPFPVYLALRQTPALAAFAQGGSNTSLVGRIYAFDSDRSDEETTNYRSLQLELTDLGIPEPYAASQYADCLYLGMYATDAAFRLNPGITNQTLTATQFAAGISQVTHSLSTGSGRADLTNDPSTIGTNLSLLAANQTTELVGAGSYLGLDPATGIPNLSAPSPGSTVDSGHSFAIYCPSAAPAAAGWNTAHVFYDKTAPGTAVLVPTGASLACD